MTPQPYPHANPADFTRNAGLKVLFDNTVKGHTLKSLGLTSTLKTLMKRAADLPFSGPLHHHPSLAAFDRLTQPMSANARQIVFIALAAVGHVSLMERMLRAKCPSHPDHGLSLSYLRLQEALNRNLKNTRFHPQHREDVLDFLQRHNLFAQVLKKIGHGGWTDMPLGLIPKLPDAVDADPDLIVRLAHFPEPMISLWMLPRRNPNGKFFLPTSLGTEEEQALGNGLKRLLHHMAIKATENPRCHHGFGNSWGLLLALLAGVSVDFVTNARQHHPSDCDVLNVLSSGHGRMRFEHRLRAMTTADQNRLLVKAWTAFEFLTLFSHSKTDLRPLLTCPMFTFLFGLPLTQPT